MCDTAMNGAIRLGLRAEFVWEFEGNSLTFLARGSSGCCLGNQIRPPKGGRHKGKRERKFQR